MLVEFLDSVQAMHCLWQYLARSVSCGLQATSVVHTDPLYIGCVGVVCGPKATSSFRCPALFVGYAIVRFVVHRPLVASSLLRCFLSLRLCGFSQQLLRKFVASLFGVP